MTIVGKGEKFLPEHTKEELIDLYRKENDPKAKIRLLAAVYRKENLTFQEISVRVKYPLTTVGDWLHRISLEGISRRYSQKQPGRPKRLTGEQIEELRSILTQSPQEQKIQFKFWTTKLVREFIEQRYGVSYKNRNIRYLLHAFGFSSQKPRRKHLRANEKMQEAFKKTSKTKFVHTLKMDMRSYFWTKASFQ